MALFVWIKDTTGPVAQVWFDQAVGEASVKGKEILLKKKVSDDAAKIAGVEGLKIMYPCPYKEEDNGEG